MHVALLFVLLAVPPATPRQSPDPCKLLTQEDVTAALGPGFSPASAAAKDQSSEGVRCVYRKDELNFVSLSIAQAEGGDAKLVLNQRRTNYEKKNKGVLEAPATCPGAFVVAVSSTNAIFMGAKGGWNTELQVMVDGKSDAVIERRLGRTVCERLP
jgi:hypothetical protein